MLPDLTPHERYQAVTRGQIRYYELGSGDQHTLLLHGMGSTNSADSFATIIEALAQRFHIYALDALGFGMSSRDMTYGPTFDVIVDGIREFMDRKGIAQANVVGHSAGGWFGSILAYESPNRVRRLVTLGGAGLNIQTAPGVMNPGVPSDEAILASAMENVHEASQLTTEDAQELARRAQAIARVPNATVSLQPLQQQMGTPEIRQQYLLQRRVGHITVPTMVVWGVREGMEPYPTWTEEWEKTGGDPAKGSKPWVTPGAKYVLLNTGHQVHWEMPDETVRLLNEFLA